MFPKLSDFCTELTTITQSDVNDAPTFPQALANFQEWIGGGGINDTTQDDVDDRSDYLLCSWGFYDRKQLKLDCELHELDPGWLKKHHISLKHQHAKICNFQQPIGMAQALKSLEIPLQGTHHRGIDDARNIAKIFIELSGSWDESKAK